jgi:hypothetical protein
MGKADTAIGATVEPPDHSTGVGCPRGVYVVRDARYSATIQLGDRTCSVTVTRR